MLNMSRRIGSRRIVNQNKNTRSPIAAPAIFDTEIDTGNGSREGFLNGVDSALTNTRRRHRAGRLVETARQRAAEDAMARQLGHVTLQGDTTGPERKLNEINALTAAEHRRITGGGGLI